MRRADVDSDLALLNSGRGDEHHALYLGVSYLLCDHEAKVMAGGSMINAIPDKNAFQAAMKPVYDKFLADNPNLKPLVKLIQNTP